MRKRNCDYSTDAELEKKHYRWMIDSIDAEAELEIHVFACHSHSIFKHLHGLFIH